MIKVLTKNASQDQLSAEDYRDIYEEIRLLNTGVKAISFDDFVEMIQSVFSKALWSKYHSGQMELNRTMRNELRVARGIPPLPPPIYEAMGNVNPNAEVIQIGEDEPDRVILIGDNREITIRVVPGQDIILVPVTTVTGPPRRRRPMSRPVASPRQMEAKESLGVKWSEIIDAGIKVLSENKETINE